jgi:hypothetical protein
MRKILLNVVSVLILSICVSSCKKDKDESIPATKTDVAEKQWVISETPIISITITGEDDKQTKAIEKLKYLFQKDDKYLFKSDSVEITRGSARAPYPKTYKIDGNHLVFDGYIKFATDISGNKLTLKAGAEEIREIVKVELPKEGFTTEVINTLLKLATGEVILVLTKEE